MAERYVVWRQLEKIVNALTFHEETEHFVISFNRRNQRNSDGNGASGLRYDDLLATYLNGLEALHATITREPYNRKGLTSGGRAKAPVYIFDLTDWSFCSGYPGVFAYPDGTPFMILPSRTNEPTREAELATAAAAAVHEATHLFNYLKKDFYHPMIDSWRWFDEAVAVQMESVVLPDNRDYLRYALRWADEPHIPLDDPEMWYDSTFFARYLDRRFGAGFSNAVWLESRENETAFETIDRKLTTLNTRFAQIFAEYCRHSFFLTDRGCPSYLPEVAERFVGRAVRESISLSAGQTFSATEALDRVSCAYYRFYPSGGCKGLNVQMTFDGPATSSPLLAQLVTVSRAGLGDIVSPVSGPAPSGSITMSVATDHVDLEFILLVVSNHGTAKAVSPLALYDDQQGFVLEVSMV